MTSVGRLLQLPTLLIWGPESRMASLKFQSKKSPTNLLKFRHRQEQDSGAQRARSSCPSKMPTTSGISANSTWDQVNHRRSEQCLILARRTPGSFRNNQTARSLTLKQLSSTSSIKTCHQPIVSQQTMISNGPKSHLEVARFEVTLLTTNVHLVHSMIQTTSLSLMTTCSD